MWQTTVWFFCNCTEIYSSPFVTQSRGLCLCISHSFALEREVEALHSLVGRDPPVCETLVYRIKEIQLLSQRNPESSVMAPEIQVRSSSSPVRLV